MQNLLSRRVTIISEVKASDYYGASVTASLTYRKAITTDQYNGNVRLLYPTILNSLLMQYASVDDVVYEQSFRAVGKVLTNRFLMANDISQIK